MEHSGFPTKSWRTATPEQTAALGARLAAGRPPRDDAPAIVYLTGDLGSGKTTFAQGFVRGCGIDEPVRSPTYALLEAYERSGLTVVHLDLYRLIDVSELEALGLRDWAKPGHVWLIEWPQKGGMLLPPADLNVALRIAESDRGPADDARGMEAFVGHEPHEIAMTATSHYGRHWLAALS